jgi:long-chain acyl-CoA synthetase
MRPVSIYPTLSSEQIAEVVGAGSPSVLVVESIADLARWRPAIDASGIQLIIVLDETVTIRGSRIISWQSVMCDGVNRRATAAGGCELRWRTVRPDDPLTIIFTSGTTGPPKGVVLTHENVLYEVHAIVAANGLDEPGTAISYLPFAHIAERILSVYLPQSHGGHVRLIADAAEVATTLREVRPTRFFGVLRIWEKIQASLNRTIEAGNEAAKRSVAQAMWIGQQYVEARQFRPAADRRSGRGVSACRRQHACAVAGRGRSRSARMGDNGGRPDARGSAAVLHRSGDGDIRRLRNDGDLRDGHRQHALSLPAR